MKTSRCRFIFACCAAVFLALGVMNAQNVHWLDDPGQIGHYAIGHTAYLVTDPPRNRPVYFIRSTPTALLR
jgi:hypothetical protein